MVFDVPDHFFSVQAIPECDQKTEPAWLTVFCRLRQDQQVLSPLQGSVQSVPVSNTSFGKGRELLQLFTSDRGLQICYFKVIAQVAVDILMVISFGKFTILSVVPVPAEIVMSRWTDAVTPPVAVRKDQAAQERIIRVNRSSLPHCHMVGRIKAAGPDIPPCTCIAGFLTDRIF